LFIVFTESSNVGQPTDDSTPISTPEISSETVPVGITQSGSQIEETFQTSSAPVEEESSSSIEVLIRAPEATTLSKDSSANSKTGKRSKRKNLLNMIFRTEMLMFTYV
jgi:hypothetical protein